MNPIAEIGLAIKKPVELIIPNTPYNTINHFIHPCNLPSEKVRRGHQ